jgi:hypothetical protein
MGGYFSITGEIYSFGENPLEVSPIQLLLNWVDPLMLSLIVFSWMPYARLVHSIVLTLKQTEFIQAARALGGSPAWIIRKHLLRNSTGPAIVLAARDVGGVVLFQATLTFIQIGGGSVWGEMLAQGRNWVIGPGGSLLRYWWVFIPPTLAVMLFGIAWNMFGDSLNDILDPTTRQTFQRRSFWDRIRKKDEIKPSPEMDALPGPVSVTRPQDAPATSEQVVHAKPLEKAPDLNGSNRILHHAREDASQGNLDRALNAYQHLIRRNRLVSDILPDLARMVKQYPGDPGVWQTLGDALGRAGQADRAAQSYERAQRLLQQQNSSEHSRL